MARLSHLPAVQMMKAGSGTRTRGDHASTRSSSLQQPHAQNRPSEAGHRQDCHSLSLALWTFSSKELNHSLTQKRTKQPRYRNQSKEHAECPRHSAPWTDTLQLAAGAGSGPLGSGGREKGPARTQAPLSHLQGPREGKKTLCPTQVLLPSFPSFLNSQCRLLTPHPLKQLRAQDPLQAMPQPRYPPPVLRWSSDGASLPSTGALTALLCICSG